MGTFSYHLTLGTICIALIGATAAAVHFGDPGPQAQGLPVATVAALPAASTDGAEATAAETGVAPATPAPRKRPRYRAVRGF
jgi:hypothetical protein